MSHPYHGHKNKQKSGILSKCQTGVAGKYPMLRSAKQTLAFVEFSTFRIEAACELANPER